MRKNDHPLPLPAIDLNTLTNTNNSLTNLNTRLHSQINIYDEIFDFDFHVDTMYIVTENSFNPKVQMYNRTRV